MARIAKVTIRGSTITIHKQPVVERDGVALDGSCDPPHFKRRTIRIAEGLTPQRELDVIIHELLHAAYWDLDESAIAETATDIAAALTLLGYKKH